MRLTALEKRTMLMSQALKFRKYASKSSTKTLKERTNTLARSFRRTIIAFLLDTPSLCLSSTYASPLVSCLACPSDQIPKQPSL